MRTKWLVSIVGVIVLGLGVGDSIAADIPCSAVAAYWNGPPREPGMPQGPGLAIVSTNIRPKDARLILDGRLVGRTRYLDGTPGYLYLEPGSYRLEIHFDGYQTIAVDLAAEVGCRYDLKYRMERVPGTPKERKSATGGKAKPFHRVFGPVSKEAEPVAPRPGSGPDTSLRRDLDPPPGVEGPSVPGAAALMLRVLPEEAKVLIDGEFVATGRELALMQGPLATAPGHHVIDVIAPGFEPVRRTIDVARGEVHEILIELSSKGAK